MFLFNPNGPDNAAPTDNLEKSTQLSTKRLIRVSHSASAPRRVVKTQVTVSASGSH